MECELEEYGPVGTVPESGAIFMANRETKKECLKMEVFALPSGFANFAKQVKAGMLLFLFEYEKRQLFGVYQACTDGGINLLPKTSSSSLKQFPAQVCFTPVWSCDPLSEKEFQYVIRKNYYSNKKFYFGLSEDQVHKLLQLFSSRKVKIELQPKQPRDDSEPFRDLRYKLRKKYDAEKLEGRNGSPDLSIRYQGHFADRSKEQNNTYRYSANVTNNRHRTNTFEQCGLSVNGSLSTKRGMEDDDRYLTNLKDQQSVHNDLPSLSLGGEYGGDTLDSNKRRKEDDDRYLMNLEDQRSVYHDVPAHGEHRGHTLGKGRHSSDSDELLLAGKVQYEDKDTTVAVRKYIPVSSDLGVAGNDMYTYVNRVVANSGDTLDSNKRRKEDDDRYLMNLKDQRSVYHDVPVHGEYRGHTLGKGRHSSDSDELLLGAKVQYEDKDGALAVFKYNPVSSDLGVAGNDMYTFVERVVGGSEHNGHVSSKSPHMRRETFSLGAKLFSDDKSVMNLGSKSTSKLYVSHQNASFSEINGNTKGSRPDFLYPLSDTKCSTQGMQNMDLHRPDFYQNSPGVVELRSGDNRPYNSSRFECEPHLGAFLSSGYSAGKYNGNTDGGGGLTGDELSPVRFGKLKASHSGEPIWSNELHFNSGQSYLSSRRPFADIQFTNHNKVEGEPAMDSFHNSVTSFGYDRSYLPNEDPVLYSEEPPPRNQNLLESQHLVRTYPRYHESMITKSIPCDSDLNFSHPDPSSPLRASSSSSLLRCTPPYHDSGEPHVGNSRSLSYHPEENHSRKFCYMDSENKSELQYSSTSANQDYYLGNTNNCFQNTEVAVNRDLGITMDTSCRSLLFATSPSANTRFPEDVVCREEDKVLPHALSPHKPLFFKYGDNGGPFSSRVCEHNRNKSSGQFPNPNWSTAGLYSGGKDLANHDSKPYTSQGQVICMGNDSAEHPLDVSHIPKISNKRSVFARLSSGPETSSREKLDSEPMFGADSTVDEVTDMSIQLKKSQLEKQEKCQMLAKHDEVKPDTHQMATADATVDELMGMLPRGKKSLVKKRKLAGQPDEEGPVEQDHSKTISFKSVNDVSQADREGLDGTLRETRLVEFKRRSEMKKNIDGSIVGRSDKSVDKRTAVEGTTGNKEVENRTAGEGTTDKPSKRRKLVRPVFVENESVAQGHESR